MGMKKILQRCMLFLFIFASQAYAQDRTISGTVTAREDGLPLPGVSLAVKGTRIGTQTSADGRFSINVPASAKALSVSYLGYITKEVVIGTSAVTSNYLKWW
jgi:hypothetical protein